MTRRNEEMHMKPMLAALPLGGALTPAVDPHVFNPGDACRGGSNFARQK
jgi:hypothetical protein